MMLCGPYHHEIWSGLAFEADDTTLTPRTPRPPQIPSSVSSATTMKLISGILLVLSATAPNVADARHRAVSTSSSSLAFNPRRGNQHHGVGSPGKKTNDPSRRSSSTGCSDVIVGEVRGGEGGGTATMSSEMFNMVKAVVGVGVLSLPAGEFFVVKFVLDEHTPRAATEGRSIRD